MRIRVLLSIFLICGVAASASPAAGQSSKKSVSSSKSKKKSTSKKRVAKKAPRQSSPTADRYREIQQALTDKGYSAGDVDGAWGPEWVDSLKRFQADQKLSVDGKLGSLSLIALGLGPKHDQGTEFAGKPEPIE